MIVTTTYVIGTIGMLVGLPIALRLLADNREDGHFGHLILIPGCAALMYAAMALDIGTVDAQGYPVPIPRYIDWLLTTPVLVGYTAHAAGMGRRWITGLVLADLLMIVFGGVAVATAGSIQWVAFGLSALCHMILLGILYSVLPSYAEQQRPERRRLAHVLQNHVGLLWLAYPLVWVFGPGLQMVSATGLAIIITFMDVVAKVPFVYFVYQARHAFAAKDTGSAAISSAKGRPAPRLQGA
jgi:sensory rhodopsin